LPGKKGDRFVRLNSHYDPAAEDFQSFLRSEDIYRKIGAMYRRGILLYGPPGEGKTSVVRTLIKNELPAQSVAIFFESLPSNEFISAMAKSLSSRFKVFVFEELAHIVERAKMENVLDFLDGESSIDRTLTIATTNYPERLPRNVVERPSRFDKVYKLGDPTAQDRKLLLDLFLAREATSNEVELTNALSTAAIKEVCLLSHLRGLTVAQAVARLRRHSELVKREFCEKEPMGFGSVSDLDLLEIDL
jgi:ATP-dependent 26S proteasome regulatory subunit